MALILRDYQVRLIDQARAAVKRVPRVLLQSATGSGKTVLVAQILAGAAARGKRAWFCVHRKELIEQSTKTFIESADIHTGVIAAGYAPAPLAPVQVCSVPSLARRLATLQAPDLLVWDECHHVASSTWSAVAQAYPKALQLGLTATPQRLDGKGLRPYFDELLTGPSVSDLIAAGYLSPYRLYAPGIGVSLDGIRRTAGDFDRKQLGAAMDGSTVVGDAVAHYREHAPDARALVFVWSIAASRELAAQFTHAGIAAVHVDGETPAATRHAAMDAFRAGTVRVICNVDLFGEGLDVPTVDAIFLLRPTQSLGLYLQQVGRGLRPSPGKDFVRIFDHVGNWERHGLPDDPRVWTLDGKQKKKRETVEASPKRCPFCFAVSPVTARACVDCGQPFPYNGRDIKAVAGVLGELTPEMLAAFKAQREEFYTNQWRYRRDCHTLQDWKALAHRLGYKPGWGYYQWKNLQDHTRK